MSVYELICEQKKSSIPQNCLAANILDLAFDMDWIATDADDIGFTHLTEEISKSEILMQLAERIALPNEE